LRFEVPRKRRRAGMHRVSPGTPARRIERY
jgi:hypothetical protein